MRYKKPCARCGEPFRPTGRYSKICNSCKKPRGRKK